MKLLSNDKEIINFIINNSENDSFLLNFINFIEKNRSYDNFVRKLKLNKFGSEELGHFFIDLLSRFPSVIFEKGFESGYNPNKHETMKLKYNNFHFDYIKDNLIVDPASLPMLCEPIKWNDDTFDGYLLNSTQQESLITGSNFHKHKVENREKLHQAINNMSSVKFSYNNNFINYLENEGGFLLDSLNNQELTDSEKYQNYMLLKVAKIYNNNPIYIPLQADWRGRIYTKSFFSNYQGGDFALSLLELYEGHQLTDEGLRYLKIYGANLFNENNTSRASYDDRIKWVDNNMEQIVNMDKNFLIKAENKFTFAAFCLIMR